MKKDSLEEWAAHVAPTLDSEKWRQEEKRSSVSFMMLLGEHYPLVEKARALTDYRDKIAFGLSAGAREILRLGLEEGPSPVNFGAEEFSELREQGLWEPGVGETKFGREVARVLQKRKDLKT